MGSTLCISTGSPISSRCPVTARISGIRCLAIGLGALASETMLGALGSEIVVGIKGAASFRGCLRWPICALLGLVSIAVWETTVK